MLLSTCPTNSFFSVSLNLYLWETEVGKFNFSNLSSKLLKSVPTHWHLINIINLLNLEIFCSYYPGNFNCTTEHLFWRVRFSGCFREFLGCQEVHFKGITRGNSYLINVQCQFLSLLIQVIFTFFASCFDNFSLRSGSRFLWVIPNSDLHCTVMLTLKK